MIERYTLPEMGRIWTETNRLQKWLEIELLACEALSKLGIITSEAAASIRQKASFDIQRVRELEQVTRHDLVAFVRCVSEGLGEHARYFHYGLTSSDVVDTALSSLMREAMKLILKKAQELEELLKNNAGKYRETVLVGRTHGIHAEPTTLGLKYALWWQEMQRNQKRMQNALETISVGKLSGAVGNYAHLDPFVEEYVCRQLGLKPAPVATQVLQRDRHAEYLFALAVTASSLEKIATEIRHLQRTEVAEVEEPFTEGQKGSSAMPHKQNPVICEQITGLARVVRVNAQASLENIALWHERDISHSSVERIIIPDTTLLVYYLLDRISYVLQDLKVKQEQMKLNLNKTRGLIFSQRVLLTLVEKGLKRDEAHDLVQDCARRCWESSRNFQEILQEDPRVTDILDSSELARCFDLHYYSKRTEEIFKRLGLFSPEGGENED